MYMGFRAVRAFLSSKRSHSGSASMNAAFSEVQARQQSHLGFPTAPQFGADFSIAPATTYPAFRGAGVTTESLESAFSWKKGLF